MKNKAARTPSKSVRHRTIRDAASQIGADVRVLKSWLRDFPVFESDAEKDFSDHDLLFARALKRLIVEERFSISETKKLIAEAGLGAVIATYGAPPDQIDPGNPALALQAAVRAAAAAGFFGPVVAEFNGGGEGADDDRPVASYAQARLARLAGGGGE